MFSDCMHVLLEISFNSLIRYSSTALHNVGLSAWCNERASLRDDSVNTLRTLAQYQDDVSPSDISCALIGYRGPPEGVDVLISHSSLLFERFNSTKSSDFTPPETS